MAMSRAFGGTRLTTRSPIRISPDVMFSSPAIMRNSVDLPQPEGPTSTTNSPSPIFTSTPWMTSVAPKAFRTSRIATDAMDAPLLGRLQAPAPRLLAFAPAGAATAAPTPGRQLDGIIGAISIPVCRGFPRFCGCKRRFRGAMGGQSDYCAPWRLTKHDGDTDPQSYRR